jgi:hypothetical protein
VPRVERRHTLWALAILGGLAFRIALLPYRGTSDMATYLQWGHDVADHGLAAAYHGIYFPLQYEVFRWALSLAYALGITGVTAIKAINLVFDLASFGVLVLLLSRLGLPRGYALLYWLHPFFLTIFGLGYVDAQVGFMLLLTLLGVTYARTPLQHVAAGVPLGLAVVMKPQADMFVAMVVIAAVIGLFGRRLGVTPAARELGRRAPLLLVAPAVIYASCAAVLAAGGRPLSYLAQTNLPSELARVFPALNANAPNIWYPVADQYRHAGDPIWTVAEPTIFNSVGTLLTLLLLVGGTLFVMRRPRLTVGQQALLIFTLPGIVGPMTLTHVHENHLFYGGIFTVATIPLVRDRRYTWAVQGLLLFWFINLAGRYGLGINTVSDFEPVRWLRHTYHDGAPRLLVAAGAIVSYVAFLAMFAWWTPSRAGTRSTARPEAAPALRERIASGVR